MFVILSEKGKRVIHSMQCIFLFRSNCICPGTVYMQRDMSLRVCMGLFVDGGGLDYAFLSCFEFFKNRYVSYL